MAYFEQITNSLPAQAKGMADGIASQILEIRKENIKRSLIDLETVGHRQNYVGTVDGVMYYDDSKAENVNATWFTFENIVSPVVWIAGGNDRQTDFSDLKGVARKNVRALVCIGNSNDKLLRTFGDDIREIMEARNIEDAVKMASDVAETDDIVLFSPACRSDNPRETYESRGQRFVASVKGLEEK